MQANAVVGRGDDQAFATVRDHPVDRLRREIGPVAEHHHGGLGLRWKRAEAAAQRRAGPAFPLRASDAACAGLDVVCAEDDQDVVDRAPPDRVQDGLEEDALLGRPKAG